MPNAVKSVQKKSNKTFGDRVPVAEELINEVRRIDVRTELILNELELLVTQVRQKQDEKEKITVNSTGPVYAKNLSLSFTGEKFKEEERITSSISTSYTYQKPSNNALTFERNPSGLWKSIVYLPSEDWQGSFGYDLMTTIDRTSQVPESVLKDFSIQEIDNMRRQILDNSWKEVSLMVMDMLEDIGNQEVENFPGFRAAVISSTYEIRGVVMGDDKYYNIWDPAVGGTRRNGF